MARELKIKVTPTIDKSLTKLMQALNSTQTLKVKVDLNDGGLGKMLKSLDSISSKTVKVGLDVDGRALNGLATRLSNLTDKKLKVGVEADDTSVKKTAQALNNLSNTAKSISKSSVVIDVDASQVPATATKLQLLGYTINDISKKSIPINLETRNILAAAKNLESLGQDISSLSRKTANISVDDSQVKKAINNVDEIGDSINDINGQTISPNVDLQNLTRMAETLDDISDKILGIAEQAIEPAVDLAEDSLDLYDTQKSFQLQMSSLGMDDKAINDIMKELNDYGAQSKYSVADMLRAYGEFRGAGNEDPMPLIKGMAGLASYGEKPNQALQALIRNMTEGNESDNVYTRDWREIRKAIGASASKQIRDWFLNNRGLELTTENFSEKMIYNGDFKQAIIDVGNSQNFQDMAQQTNTLSSAIENLKESFTVGIIGDMEDQGPMAKFTQGLIKQINDFTDAVPMVADRLSGTLEKVMTVFGKSFSGFNAKDFLTDIFDALDSFVDFATPFIERVGKLTNSGKDLGKFVGNVVKYAAQLKIALRGFRTLSSVTDFASDGLALFKNLKGGASVFANGSSFGGGGVSNIAIPAPNDGVTQKVGLWSKLNSGIQKGALTVSAVAGSMVIMTEALKRVAAADIPVDGLVQNSLKITIATTALSGIYFAISKLSGGIKGDVMQGVGIVLAVGASVVMLSEAFKYIANVDIPIDSLAANVAIVSGAIGVLSLLYGVISKLGGGLTGDISKGAVIALEIAGSMLLLTAAFKTIGAIKINIEGIVNNVSTITLGVVTMGALFGGLGFALSALAPLSGFIIAGISTALVIAGAMTLLSGAFRLIAYNAKKTTSSLVGVARNLNELNNIKVPGFKTLENKINAISTDISKINEAIKGIGGEGFWSSLISTFEASFDATTAQKAIQMFRDYANFAVEFNNIELPDLGSLKTKITDLSEIIGDMDGAFEKIGGKGFWSSLIEMLESGFDATTAERAIEMFTNVANFVKELNRISIPDVNTTDKEENDTAFDKKITRIGEIIGKMKTATDEAFGSKGNLGALIKSILDKWTADNNAENLQSILDIFNGVITFANNVRGLEVPKDINDKIEDIKKVIDKLNKYDWSGIQEIDKDTKNKLENISSSLESLSSVAESIKGLGDLPDADTVRQRLDSLKVIIEQMSNIDFSGVNFKNIIDREGDIKKLTTFMGKVKNMSTSLKGIAENELPDNIVDIIEKLKAAISKIQEIDTSGFGGKETNMESAKEFVEGISNIAIAIGKMQEYKDRLADLDSINQVLDNIKALLSDGGAIKTLQDLISEYEEFIDIQPLTNFVNGIYSIAESVLKLDGIGNQFQDMSAFDTAMSAISAIFSKDGPLLKIKKAVEENFEEELKTDNVVNFIGGIMAIATKLTEAETALANINLETLLANLEKLSGGTANGKSTKGIFDALADVKEQFVAFTGLGGSVSAESEARADLGHTLPQVKTTGNSSVLNSDLAEEVTAMVEAILSVAKKLVELQGLQLDITAIVSKVQVLNNALGYIKGIGDTYKDLKGTELDNASKLVDKAVEMTEKLNTLPALVDGIMERITTLKDALTELNGLGTQFSSTGITTAMTAINNLATSLENLSNNMKTVGGNFAGNFIDGFLTRANDEEKGLVQIKDKVKTAVIDKLNELSDLSEIGAKMSKTLADGFSTFEISQKVAEIKGILQGLEGIEVDITPTPKISGKGKKTKRENGGIIPEYHSSGGRVGSRLFRPQGTDTVPAMLTAGEYVLKRSVTSALGKGFLDKLNQMNLNGALLTLANKTGQSIVNNTTNNITQNVDNKASYMNGLSDIGRVVRI